MLRAFPVQVIPHPAGEVRTPSGRACTSSRLWFADWHDVVRPSGRVHHAQDILAPLGSLVLAPEDGRITESSAQRGPTERGGHFLRLATPERVYYFAHLREAPDVNEGERVEAGEVLGRVGRTGNASRTCPHLHLSARDRRRPRIALNLYDELRAAEAGEEPETMANDTEVAELQRRYSRAGQALYRWVLEVAGELPYDAFGDTEERARLEAAGDNIAARLRRNYWDARGYWAEAMTASRAGEYSHALEMARIAVELMERSVALAMDFQQSLERAATEVPALLRFLRLPGVRHVVDILRAAFGPLGEAARGFGQGAGAAAILVLIVVAVAAAPSRNGR